MQKNQTGLLPQTMHKNKFKMYENLKCNMQNHSLLEENIGIMSTSIRNNNYNSPTFQHIFVLYKYGTFAFYRNRFNILSLIQCYQGWFIPSFLDTYNSLRIMMMVTKVRLTNILEYHH